MTIDPQIAEAMVGFAYARLRASFYGWSTPAEDTYAAQLEVLTKATAINPGYAFAYYVKSLALAFKKQFPEAIEAAQTAVALDPNAAYAYFAMGQAEISLGRCEQSIAHIRQAFALSPRDPVGVAPGTRSWAPPRFAWVGLTRRLGSLSEELTRGTGPFFRTPFWRVLRPRKGTMPRRNLLWQKRFVSILNSRSNFLRRQCRRCQLFSMACARLDCRKNDLKIEGRSSKSYQRQASTLPADWR